jgi:hypothetical protein
MLWDLLAQNKSERNITTMKNKVFRHTLKAAFKAVSNPKAILQAVLIAGTIATHEASAQTQPNDPGSVNYSTAIGLRGGETSGLTVKHFFNTGNAIEGIIGFWPSALSVTGLYEHNVPAGPDGLYWYYGGGAHLAFQTGRIYYVNEGMRYYRYTDDALGFGIDGVLGIEYKVPPIPFAFSLDIKPFIEVNTRGRAFVALDPGLGIKVAF